MFLFMEPQSSTNRKLVIYSINAPKTFYSVSSPGGLALTAIMAPQALPTVMVHAVLIITVLEKLNPSGHPVGVLCSF